MEYVFTERSYALMLTDKLSKLSVSISKGNLYSNKESIKANINEYFELPKTVMEE